MTILSEIVSKRLAEIGRGPTQAEGVGKLGRNFVTDIVGGKKSDIRSKSLPGLAKALDWSTAELLLVLQRAGLRFGDTSIEEVATSGAGTMRLTPNQHRVFDMMPEDVPVYGIAAASAVGSFVIDGQIDVVKRPPGLVNARNIYALYVHGDSMSPRHRSGDLIFISPDRPPRLGDDVVIQTKTHGSAPIQSWVKEYDHMTEEIVVVRQLNPEGKIEFKRETVAAIHRVLTMRELFGA